MFTDHVTQKIVSFMPPRYPNYYLKNQRNNTVSNDTGTRETDTDADYLFLGNKTSTVVDNRTQSEVQVIILTQYRSGSSFTGELFNQNTDFVYFFEPLGSIKANVNKPDLNVSEFGQLSKDLLSGILRKDFTHLPPQLQRFYRLGKGAHCNFMQSAVLKALNLCPNQNQGIHIRQVREVSRRVAKERSRIQTPFARRTAKGRGGRYQPPGRPTIRHQQKSDDSSIMLMNNMKILEKTTKARKGIAIKTIRLRDILTIKDLLLDPDLNLKILHLVRDPRGVMNSRTKLRKSLKDRRRYNTAEEARVICEHMDRNSGYQDQVWLKDRYHLVRYEDVAEQPLKLAEEIYKFVGIDMPSSVADWLRQNTDHRAGGQYGRTRNSTKTAHQWRSEIEFSKVMAIQRSCLGTLSDFGYIPVKGNADLKNPEYKTLAKLPDLTSGILAE